MPINIKYGTYTSRERLKLWLPPEDDDCKEDNGSVVLYRINIKYKLIYDNTFIVLYNILTYVIDVGG